MLHIQRRRDALRYFLRGCACEPLTLSRFLKFAAGAAALPAACSLLRAESAMAAATIRARPALNGVLARLPGMGSVHSKGWCAAYAAK